MRLVRGGDNDVLSGAQAEALRHLAQVDVGLGAGLGGVEQEEILRHVLLVPVHLQQTDTTAGTQRILIITPMLRIKTKGTTLIMCGENGSSARCGSHADVAFRVNTLHLPHLLRHLQKDKSNIF